MKLFKVDYVAKGGVHGLIEDVQTPEFILADGFTEAYNKAKTYEGDHLEVVSLTLAIPADRLAFANEGTTNG